MFSSTRIGAFIVFGLVAAYLLASPFVAYGTQRDVIATVTNTERVCSGGENVSCKYLIFTDQTTFENTDTMWFLKWNSSDLYGRLQHGRTYRFHVNGWRFPLLSWYPNILTAEPVS